MSVQTPSWCRRGGGPSSAKAAARGRCIQGSGGLPHASAARRPATVKGTTLDRSNRDKEPAALTLVKPAAAEFSADTAWSGRQVLPPPAPRPPRTAGTVLRGHHPADLLRPHGRAPASTVKLFLGGRLNEFRAVVAHTVRSTRLRALPASANEAQTAGRKGALPMLCRYW